jgi:hypothetical protein
VGHTTPWGRSGPPETRVVSGTSRWTRTAAVVRIPSDRSACAFGARAPITGCDWQCPEPFVAELRSPLRLVDRHPSGQYARVSITYVTRFDGVRVPTSDYRPVWLSTLADDVTLEGSAMNGVVQGSETVRAIVTYIRTLYDSQEFNFAGPYGENGFLEDYTAHVRGEQLGNVVLVTRNAAGQAQQIVANYRPRTTLLLVSRLIGEHFADTPYGAHFASSDPE